MNADESIYALHRYFIWANRMRDHFHQSIEAQGPPPAPDDHPAYMAWLIGPFAYVSYWFAALYVVTEGWHKLGLSDSKIDALLDSSYCDLLKRYRNGVFHYQKTYFDRRFRDFIDKGDDIAEWADKVHNEVSRYFLEWYRSRGYDYSLQKLDNGEIQILLKNTINKNRNEQTKAR